MNSWEIAAFLFLGGMALVSLMVETSAARTLTFSLGGVCVLWMVGAVVFYTPEPDVVLQEALPARENSGAYTSSDACRSCHPSQYATWHRSFHRTMTQAASPDSVQAPFDDVTLTLPKRTFRLERQGDEFWVQLRDPEADEAFSNRGRFVDEHALEAVTRRVVMTTGSHHYQGYWITSPIWGLTQLPFVYHLQEHRWIPRQAAFLHPPRPPSAQLVYAHWGNNCVRCHSTAGQPRISPDIRRLEPQVAELGISCEACHGPGRDHIAYYRNPVRRYFKPRGDHAAAQIVNPVKCEPDRASQICGQCHSFFYPRDADDWRENGLVNAYQPGDSLDQSCYVLRPKDHPDEPWLKEWLAQLHGVESTFWPEGTIRVGGREFNGLIESPCYQRGPMSCLSCHSMHGGEPDDQLATGMRTDRACVQCHQSHARDIEAHTHHSADSSGSRCMNCHMPHTTYALFKGIRSHRITSPEISTVRGAKPNACNLCHLDESLAWTATHLQQWYGQDVPELAAEHGHGPASVDWLLRGDAAQRVVTAWHYGWEPAVQVAGVEPLPPLLAILLEDPYAAVRMVAYRSLRRLPGCEDLQYDFLGRPADWTNSRQDVINRWNRELPAATRDRFAPLFGDNGRLNEAEVQRVLADRDDREIYISE